ncbi:MAG: hypothetical protein KC620_21925, partial [Myxococcales bacterium]|nr:hypothetical protein [Myxococcales bacterium]
FDADAPQAPLPLARSVWAREILRRAPTWPRTLGEVAEVTRGVNPYHHTTHTADQIAARVHHAAAPAGPDWVPEVRGRDLPEAFVLTERADRWLQYGPWLKEPRDPRFFRGPRLLVRKIFGPTLCAVFLDRPLHCDQSVYIARLRDGQPYDPFALLACVASRVIAALLKARHQEHDALFPQLKVAELRAVPLPPVPPGDPHLARAAEAARALQAGTADDRAATRAALEAAIAAAYGVPPAHD